MTEEILEKIKKEYEQRKQKQNEIKGKIKRLNELKKNPFVIEYIELTDFINNSFYHEYTDEEIMVSSFNKYISEIKDTNGIYIYLGTFRLSNICDIEHGPSDERVSRNDPSAKYSIYQDIEKFSCNQIPIKHREQFEKHNKIIFPKTINTNKYFYELQKEFIRECINSSQEEACQKLLSKVK